MMRAEIDRGSCERYLTARFRIAVAALSVTGLGLAATKAVKKTAERIAETFILTEVDFLGICSLEVDE